MTQLLEQSMRDICAAHDLLNIGITCHAGHHIAVTVQWNDVAEDNGRGCAFGRGDTIADCVADAIRQRNEARPVVNTLADVAIEQVLA